MSDYKATLNLPKTDFPMKANLAEREPTLLKQWETLNLYDTLRAQGKSRPLFILHDGPPYANGNIHIGHAINKILKDFVIKSKTLSGFEAAFVPGWDCHGLPTELNVEKKIGKAGYKVSHQEFRLVCREYAVSQVNIQREQFKRLGIIADWENPYLTMNFKVEANILRSLARIIQNGHLKKGAKPVHWCLDCASALAEAEVEYIDKSSLAIDVLFEVADEAAFLACFNNPPAVKAPFFIPIWTTTPWTLPANEGVALNPALDYVLVISQDKPPLLVSEALVESVVKRYGITEYHLSEKQVGSTFAGLLVKHPLFQKEVSIILGDHVTIEAGTGAVHTAPAHGEEDYLLGKKYHLPLISPVQDDGCYRSDLPLFAGLHVSKVNELVVAELSNKGTLIHAEKMTHSYPHCWRHKSPLIYRATPQWFISMDQNGLRAEALAAIQRVKWIPEWGQNRIHLMVENRPDWCISRQRSWGVPIALFLHKVTKELHPDTINLMEKVAERIEKEGIEAWYSLDPNELLGADAPDYLKNTDILDVWFDSGVTHESVLNARSELQFPADLYLEGSDQHRGWFNSSLITSIAMKGVEPYKTVLTHGFTLDKHGRKMSKSLGNVISPEKITQTLGADILRLWVSAIDYRGDVIVSDEVFSRTSETYRRIRNTARFLLANLDGFDPEKHLVPAEKLLALDCWVIERAKVLQTEIITAFDAYQFNVVNQKIHQFCSSDLGSFYLDIIKDRQYTTQPDSLARRSTQTALYYIAEALVRWLAPILSFTADEIWQYLPGKRNASVFLNTWYEQWPTLPQTRMDHPFWQKIRLIRDAVNKQLEQLRNEGKLGSTLEAAVYLYADKELHDQLKLLENELRFILITSTATVYSLENTPEHDLIATDIPGLKLTVEPLHFQKCERCWHRTSDIGQNAEHPTLCGRCIENVIGVGESRQYA